MKGERIIAELLGIVGMLVYGVMLQHLYAEVQGRPERSWINQARTWWLTRGSRSLERRLRVYTLTKTSEEPTPAAE